MLKGKKILLCVTGGIAVFKAAALTSKLTQAGALVKVMMSESAMKFVTPLTFQALSRHDVYTDTFDEKDSAVIAHIDLADWADVVLIAPATANCIGKLANGIADDMITTTLLATTAPVWIAPAMNVHMYENKIVQKNMMTLKALGYTFIEPGEGFLACGYVAKGRLEEPETIIARLQEAFSEHKPLKGKKILVTAGPTREKIDPVRFMTNFSSGKMGYALAEVAANLGADVILVSGPTAIAPPVNVTTVQVESAQDMLEAVMQHYGSMDVVIKTAAVADYRPKIVHNQKMKKKSGDAVIELERTIDILKTLGEKKEHQLLIGFAAETTNIEEYATKKLREKNANMIVANDVKAQGAGFGTDTNIVTMYRKDGEVIRLPLLTKKEVAREILMQIEAMLEEDRV
ncbi:MULTISPECIES: bifunctional phosphopantothenoylcysteine decarboxylase/phosphopantothenate--cysteine ligase CoaBC [Bacillus cereus group]|uniref:bifunctional phosphopantothenoylcysteine decarboxylase/phosphopantothenate--cysteine ligase CoaBC n=1 Tax=Bacillus cereus group TaxID=86661 RepID=UPI00032E973B|nr:MULTISPECIES: bifunctional phosphopantothenoylcysteine decarboxylase/phosphopantothenate--cysteine ligase CoaBC [Bacillus cereus group]EOP50416.1 phosphopantothenoylcysteine decarboxylase/phosphopantothenate-cysteine ligase [Bacillus cereus VD136]MDF2082375.1 bifunctional phosphopantothenoylcysteine decarboxylase/phosphopantothenate--cysteine ligase CoaBC [Bacillus pseudomycoides]PEE43712.1 bifunctional phosphopantothenoylcysteine decarboxylase/phosphopantothenate--cysteine ligase CoaBC [Baci